MEIDARGSEKSLSFVVKKLQKFTDKFLCIKDKGNYILYNKLLR